MARTGRKRKYRGAALRKTPAERAPDYRAMSALQPHRRWLPESVRLSEKAASMLGCLNLKNLISDEEHEAGRLYSVAIGSYRAIIGVPTGTAGNGRGYDCNPVGCRPDQCECLRRTSGYLAARFALADAGEAAMHAVERLVLDDLVPDFMADLKCGLFALQQHYGLTPGSKSSNRRNTNSRIARGDGNGSLS